MITIKNTSFTSDVHLSSMLRVLTKEKMLKISKTLDLWVSPNVKKDEMARRLASDILANPINVLCQLCKTELHLLDEIEQGGPNHYVQVKARKTCYKLQKFGLVLTYEDTANNQWHLLMPDEVRESLKTSYPAYLRLADEGKKGPTPRGFRFYHMLKSLGEV